MIRNFKALGLALVAVFALAAVSASAASAANGKLTSTGPMFLLGTDITGQQNAFTAFSQSVECPDSSYVGEAVGGGTIASGSETVTVLPNYNNATCNVGGVKATVHMNGCDYVLHIGTTTGTAGQYNGTVDVVCGVGQVIDVEIFASAKNENVKTCTVEIAKQTGKTGGTVTNTASGLKLGGTVTAIAAKKSGSCGNEETTTATYDLNVEVKGTNKAGAATAIEISD